MFLIYSVGDKENQIRLSRGTTVALLVAGALYASGWAFQRVAEIRREAQFEAELARNLEELIVATDSIAAHHVR